ncbi:MAG TPA: sensor histidine kinase, partial [Jatrophihabitans sp.]|nr:sensor histidine kinase [Jatrophihabitans sp.]
YSHEARFYAGAQDFLAATVPFIEAGLSAGEPVHVVTRAARLDQLRGAIPPHELLHLADMDVVGSNPGLIIAAWADFVQAHAGPATPVRGIGEPVHPDRAPVELAACQLHEELLNLAFDASTPLWLICPYDTSALPDDVLEHARAAHPQVSGAAGARTAPGVFSRPDPAALLDRTLDPRPDGVVTLEFGAEMLGELRSYVRAFAVQVGVSATRAEDLVVAINEVTTNTVRHGGGAGELRLWAGPDRIVCEVSDDGRIADPLIGRRPPPAAAAGGRGVWLANMLCDLLQIRSGADGTTVRLHIRR